MNVMMKYVLKCLPHHAITNLVSLFMKSKISRFAIPAYVKWYNIDLSHVEKPVEQYRSLNEFFKRKLIPYARPIDQNNDTFISPADGLIKQVGRIDNGQIIQAKGVSYSVDQLLADEERAKFFQNGTYMTIYLSPKDYHRIHAPIDGTITDFSYIPGRLYPVNDHGVESIEGVYSKNERLTTFMRTPVGQVAVVKVGALIVGSVQLAYKKQIERVHKGKQYAEALEGSPFIHKGTEMGHFEFGSTVILLFEEDQIDLLQSIQPGTDIKVGEPIGYKMEQLKRKVE
ncbi:archaetidylserine decarboxylase [Pseudalkalibacillus sp. SCS-8]|uniref:archaetidylserine decarboxylase n=1 Tax=Pseudalkalibacillus nanhaiensis TaxID=3115291 RepID=UPI0032DBD6D1